jgi:multidrug efflux pump subunit AcrA (membrane-fusion protein)
LTNALEHNSLFLMPVWRTIGKSKFLVSARMLPKTLAVAIGVVVLLISLFFIPADFNLHGRGKLEPLEQRDVYAQSDGIVTDVLVDHGSDLKAGQELVKMISNELDSQIIKAVGEIQGNNQKIASLQTRQVLDQGTGTDEDKLKAEQVNGELRAALAQQESLDEQLRLLEEKKATLTVRSPIDGTIVTWKPKDNLKTRPVGRGEKILRVADPSKDWELELRMPEERMGHIQRAQKELSKNELEVSYILATDPSRTLYGTVKEIHEAAEVQPEEGNIVLVRVKINRDDLNADAMRPDAAVSAKINCGRRSLGYVWFHDVFEFIQSKVLFRL